MKFEHPINAFAAVALFAGIAGCSGDFEYDDARFACGRDSDCPADQECNSDGRCRPKEQRPSQNDIFLPDFGGLCDRWIKCEAPSIGNGEANTPENCVNSFETISRVILLSDQEGCAILAPMVWDLELCGNEENDCPGFNDRCLPLAFTMFAESDQCPDLKAIFGDSGDQPYDIENVEFVPAEGPCIIEMRCQAFCQDAAECAEACYTETKTECTDCLSGIEQCISENECNDADMPCPECDPQYKACYGLSPYDIYGGKLPGIPPCREQQPCFLGCQEQPEAEQDSCMGGCLEAGGPECQQCLQRFGSCLQHFGCEDTPPAAQCRNQCDGLYFSCFGSIP